MLVLIFNKYVSVLPNSLIILEDKDEKKDNNDNDTDDDESAILAKLRAIMVIIDRLNELFKRSNSLKTRYLTQMTQLNTSISFLLFSLYSRPIGVSLSDKPWSDIPYKLPSTDIQMELIEFWSKYPLFIPNNINFRTNYLLRWICILPTNLINIY